VYAAKYASQKDVLVAGIALSTPLFTEASMGSMPSIMMTLRPRECAFMTIAVHCSRESIPKPRFTFFMPIVIEFVATYSPGLPREPVNVSFTFRQRSGEPPSWPRQAA